MRVADTELIYQSKYGYAKKAEIHLPPLTATRTAGKKNDNTSSNSSEKGVESTPSK